VLTVIGLLIIIGAVVAVHELGHFIAARLVGAKVDVFSIGFGRPIVKWTDRKGTEWRLAWIPLGGFVGIYGQDEMFDRKAFEKLPKEKKIGHYLSLSAWKQAVVIGAGVFMNMILAWTIYTGLLMTPHKIQRPVVGESAALEIKPGDTIVRFNGKKIETWGEMLTEKELAKGEENNLLILRGEKLIRAKMQSGQWGILPNADKTEIIRYGLFGAMGRAATELWTQSKLMLTVLKQIAMGERSAKQLGGIIRIADLGGRALAAGFAAMLTMIALVSISIGIVNLLPFPVLDGGFLMILIIEAATGRKLQGRAMDWALRAGWALLIALILFTIWNDLTNLIRH
jgi:regulator of sigma E protease